MISHRIVDSDPVRAVTALMERGFKPNTLLTLYTGTKHHAKAVRKLLDTHGHNMVGLQYKGELLMNVKLVGPEGFKPEVIECVSTMFRQTKVLGRDARLRYEPAKTAYLVKFYHKGVEPIYAVDAKVTEFTRDITKARVASHARLSQMFLHVDRYCNNVTVPKTYSVDGEQFKVDAQFCDNNQYATTNVWIDVLGNHYYSDDEYQTAMAELEREAA
jgi:hypothetical protein